MVMTDDMDDLVFTTIDNQIWFGLGTMVYWFIYVNNTFAPTFRVTN